MSPRHALIRQKRQKLGAAVLTNPPFLFEKTKQIFRVQNLRFVIFFVPNIGIRIKYVERRLEHGLGATSY